MIPILSAVYELLLEITEEFQRNLNPEIRGSSSSSCVGGNDVYFTSVVPHFVICCINVTSILKVVRTHRGILFHKK